MSHQLDSLAGTCQRPTSIGRAERPAVIHSGFLCRPRRDSPAVARTAAGIRTGRLQAAEVDGRSRSHAGALLRLLLAVRV